MDTQQSQAMADKKGPLESRTVQVAALQLITAVVGHFAPPVGAWLAAHNAEVLSVFAVAYGWARTGGAEKIDWTKWGAIRIFDKKL